MKQRSRCKQDQDATRAKMQAKTAKKQKDEKDSLILCRDVRAVLHSLRCLSF